MKRLSKNLFKDYQRFTLTTCHLELSVFPVLTRKKEFLFFLSYQNYLTFLYCGFNRWNKIKRF